MFILQPPTHPMDLVAVHQWRKKRKKKKKKKEKSWRHEVSESGKGISDDCLHEKQILVAMAQAEKVHVRST